MPRSRFLGQRDPLPDVRYRDKLVGKFLNILMECGKKSTAERICYGAFDVIQEKTGSDPLKVFRTAIDNVKPIVEVKSRRVGVRRTSAGEIRTARRMSLGLRCCRVCPDARRQEHARKIAAELLDASNNTGAAVKKRSRASDGGGQQGVRPLSLVTSFGAAVAPCRDPFGCP